MTKLLSMTTSLECSPSLRHHQSQPLLLKLDLSQLLYLKWSSQLLQRPSQLLQSFQHHLQLLNQLQSLLWNPSQSMNSMETSPCLMSHPWLHTDMICLTAIGTSSMHRLRLPQNNCTHMTWNILQLTTSITSWMKIQVMWTNTWLCTVPASFSANLQVWNQERRRKGRSEEASVIMRMTYWGTCC